MEVKARGVSTCGCGGGEEFVMKFMCECDMGQLTLFGLLIFKGA